MFLLIGIVANLVSLMRGPQARTAQGEAVASPTTSPEPGWYPDPYEEARLRWWEGDRWSDRVSQ